MCVHVLYLGWFVAVPKKLFYAHRQWCPILSHNFAEYDVRGNHPKNPKIQTACSRLGNVYMEVHGNTQFDGLHLAKHAAAAPGTKKALMYGGRRQPHTVPCKDGKQGPAMGWTHEQKWYGAVRWALQTSNLPMWSYVVRIILIAILGWVRALTISLDHLGMVVSTSRDHSLEQTASSMSQLFIQPTTSGSILQSPQATIN